MKSKVFLSALFFILCFSSCKRYEEDPITLRTPENRISRSWYLQSCTLDGKDSLDFMIRNKLAEKWSFGGCRSSSQCYFGILNGSGSIATYSGNWQINDESGDLYIENINIKYWIDLTYCSFTILKLTTKELKIQDCNSRALLYFRSSKE